MFKSFAAVAAFLLCAASPASASVVLTYTGNPFENVNPAIFGPDAYVSASLTLDAPLGNNLSNADVTSNVQAFSISAGYKSINSDPGFSFSDGNNGFIYKGGCEQSFCPSIMASFSTDDSGNITEWFFYVGASQYAWYSFIETINTPAAAIDVGHIYSAGSADNHDSPGGWSIAETQIAGVPEPATWAIFLIGFGVAGFALRRNRVPAVAV